MTYRDDHDAALERADALQDEVDRIEHERDDLAAKVAKLEAEAKHPPEPEKDKRAKPVRNDRDAEARGKRIWRFRIAAAVALLVAFVVALVGILAGAKQGQARRDWDQQQTAIDAHATWRLTQPSTRREAHIRRPE